MLGFIQLSVDLTPNLILIDTFLQTTKYIALDCTTRHKA